MCSVDSPRKLASFTAGSLDALQFAHSVKVLPHTMVRFPACPNGVWTLDEYRAKTAPETTQYRRRFYINLYHKAMRGRHPSGLRPMLFLNTLVTNYLNMLDCDCSREVPLLKPCKVSYIVASVCSRRHASAGAVQDMAQGGRR